MGEHDILSFDVTLPASELATLQRRVRFLEAALIQVLRDGNRIKEWFGAAELAGLALPGMPATAAGVTRLAKSQGWRVRKAPCQGGHRHLYHFSSLPRRAFETVIERIVTAPLAAVAAGGMAPDIPAPPPPPMTEHDGRTVPQWVLPLMRLMRGGETVAEAVRELPQHLPSDVPCPTPMEAYRVLSGLGLVG